jgi:ribosomal protein S18 acetylase RimI-like enzyme
MYTFEIKRRTVAEIVQLLTIFDPYSDKPYSFRDSANQKQWPEKLAALANCIVCYDINGQAIGTLFFYDNEVAIKNQEGYCVFFCVLPEYRRCGVASQMIEKVKEHLKSIGIPNFKLKCSKTNIAAFKLYQKTGFDVIDEEENKYVLVSRT